MPQPKFGPDGPDRLLAEYRNFLIRQISAYPADVDMSGLRSGANSLLPSLLFNARIDPLPAMERLFEADRRWPTIAPRAASVTGPQAR